VRRSSRVEAVNMTFILFTVVLGVAAAVWGNWCASLHCIERE
jgi:hypothetical protein